MIVFRYDGSGFYVEPVEIEEGKPIPLDCTRVPLPSVNYKPKFVDGAWVETLTQAEIDELLNAPVPLSPLDELKKQQADLIFELMMNGVI